MRHEAPVQLTEHRLRAGVPTDHNMTNEEVKEYVDRHATYTDRADFDLLKFDYDWPNCWTWERQLLATYCANSEFQLVMYIKALRGATISHVFDKKMHSVFCMHNVEWTKK